MFKTIQIIVMAALCLNFNSRAQSQSTIPLLNKQAILGNVISSTTGEALTGVVIKVTAPSHTTVSNDKGEFILTLSNGTYNLSISHLGYKTKSVRIQIPLKEPLVIKLDNDDKNLQEVEIVSTGYQNIPKERATGSFTLIDNKLLNRAVSPDLLTRLKGITNGLLFDNATGNALGISLRGRSTIFSNTSPLIVVDNFPFEGDLNTLNPDIIENVTILKDAAAASIWGVRAGNGVIVITTKKGRLNRKPVINIKSDLTLGDQPDLYYQPQLTSSEFIDVEQFLFEKGKYLSTINNGYEAISPVVAILQKIKSEPGYAIEGKEKIDALRKIDSRDQLSKYFLQNSIRQHYFTDVSGGGTNQSYYFSAGYDKNLPNFVFLSDSRITLKGSNTYNLLNDKLKLNVDINFSKSTSKNENTKYSPPILPYEQLADENGNALATVYTGGLRESYTDTAGNNRLLDWKYRPLDELRNKNSTSIKDLTDYRLNLGLVYKILKPLSVSVNYQYYSANSKIEAIDNVDSYYTRNIINTYSQINTTTGEVKRPVPLGDIYMPSFIGMQSHYGRGQIDFNERINDKHELTIIAGYEIRSDDSKINSYTVYGYSPETGTNIQIDPISQFRNYYSSGSLKIPLNNSQYSATNRYISWYGNASYIFDNRFIVSGSYRKDESNLFGVKANQKGVPLWSSGLAWNVNKESFFKIDWLSSLQLKATYGYNGNVNNSISAYLTASPSFNNAYNVQYYEVVNPPNDNFRWERVKNINMGLYFSTKKDWISGSIEYYIKNGFDLIATSPIAPQTGILLFTGNTADTHTSGIDISLNSNNFNNAVKWNTAFNLSIVKDVITDYKVASGTNNKIVTAHTNSLAPLVGYPVNAVFAYKWAGLDGSGNPQGYLNDEVSLDYTAIRNTTDPTQLKFFGSATPTLFGNIRNTFSYKNLELSINISYKYGYYFRRNSLSYQALFGGQYMQADYNKRWQNPGDELITTVPSAVYPVNTIRNDFYNYASVLVERGDHIRLQDIQVNYNLTKDVLKSLPFYSINIYAYATNLGLLWKANKQGLDPDVRSGYPNPKSIAFGIKTTF